jgi:hypothetical protein
MGMGSRVRWIGLVLGTVACGSSNGKKNGTGSPDGGADSALLQPSDLTYLGAFRLPQGASGNDPNGFSYSAGFTAGNVYYDSQRGNAPTLFISGYLSAGYVSSTPSLAQVSIPELADPAQVGAAGLQTATLFQPFADPSGGHNPLSGNGFCSYVAVEALLGFCAVAYDSNGSQPAAAFVNGSYDLANSDAAGPYRVGSSYQTLFGSYATLVPPEWQAALGSKVVAGNGPWSVISVNSAGPGIQAVDANALLARPAAGTTISSTPLADYPIDHQQLGAWNSNLAGQMINGIAVPTITVSDPQNRSGLPVGGGGPTWTIPYNDSTMRILGAAFPDGTRSVLFFGKKGLGPYCYGQGTNDAALQGTTVPNTGGEVVYCYDPSDPTTKGDHAYPYSYFVWAYDVNDYIAVVQGTRDPWMVFPYSGWTFTLFGAGDMFSGLGGAAWDATTRRLYLAAQCTDTNCQPLIHAYQVR